MNASVTVYVRFIDACLFICMHAMHADLCMHFCTCVCPCWL